MSILDYVNYLGLSYGEEALQPLLAQLKLTKVPKLAKGDTTTHLSAKALGVVLCFKDEERVKIPGKEFPEGALVLSSISFYADGTPGYKAYTGAILPGITWQSNRQDVMRALGMPNAPAYSSAGELLPGQNDRVLRWDRNDHCLFFAFTGQERIRDASVQLPLDQA